MKIHLYILPFSLCLLSLSLFGQGCKSSSNAAPPEHAAGSNKLESNSKSTPQSNSDQESFENVQSDETVILADDISEEVSSTPAGKSAEVEVLAELREKQREIEEKWVELAKRDSEIKKIDGELDSRLSSITKLEERLERLLGIGRAAQDRRSERVSALAELISTMPPQSGAEIMAKMTDIDAQAILLAIAQKSERKAAKVLALMPSERAAQLGQKYISVETKLPGSEGLIAHDSPGGNSSANNPTSPTAQPSKTEPTADEAKASNDAAQTQPESSRNP